MKDLNFKLLIIIACLLQVLTLAFTVQAHALTVTATVPPHDILQELNKYRAKYNLQPVKTDPVLCKLAETRAKETKYDWSHKQFQGEIDKIQRMPGVFYENLARNYEPQDVVWAWSMSKAGHREAMLVPELALGCVIRYEKYYAFEGYKMR